MKRLLFIMIACLFGFISAPAQEVYVFLFDYMDNDGIKSKRNDGSIENYDVQFIAVSNNRIGMDSSSKNSAFDNWDKLESGAIKWLNQGYQSGCKWECKKVDDFSTSTKTTYRMHFINTNPPIPGMELFYHGTQWDDKCYTISNDYTQLIIWWVNSTKTKKSFLQKNLPL